MTESSIAIMILFGTLIVLMFIRIPIAFSLGISAVVTALYMDIPLMNLFMKMVTSLQNFVIVACPFFCDYGTGYGGRRNHKTADEIL